jgi:hypothetical protein
MFIRFIAAALLGTTLLALPAFAQTEPKDAKTAPAATGPAAKPGKSTPSSAENGSTARSVNSKAAKPAATSTRNAPTDAKGESGCQHGMKDSDA